MSEGIDMRLFQSGIEKGSPQLAAVEMLTIAEVVAEQPVLSCFCRFSRWNPLTPEVRYYVPQGYQLVSVNSVNGGDLVVVHTGSYRHNSAAQRDWQRVCPCRCN